MKIYPWSRWWRRALVAAVLVIAPRVRAAATDGTTTFTQICAMCHGLDGKAQTPIGRKIGVKDLTVSTLTEAEIARRVTEGYRDQAGTQKMPAYGAKLSAEQIAAVAKYVVGLRH